MPLVILLVNNVVAIECLRCLFESFFNEAFSQGKLEELLVFLFRLKLQKVADDLAV
jgi:hypothetical protein